MKKWFVLLFLIGMAYLLAHRQRLFLRDPLATLMRNGVKEDGAQIYINYSNDVLIENDHPPAYTEIVQHGGNMGQPSLLKCFHFVVCETDANAASLSRAEPQKDLESMDAKRIEFIDWQGRQAVVTLR